MLDLNSWKFPQNVWCYGHRKIFWLTYTVTFIHLFINSLSSAHFISANNIQHPYVTPSHSVYHHRKTAGVQERECFIGRICDYEIPEDIFLCKVKTYVISTKGERFLPKWLSFNEEQQTFLGIPSEKEEGIHEILIAALGKLPNNPAGYICGSTTLKITVWKLRHYPLFVENSLLGVKQGNFNGKRNTCGFNEPVILASMVLSIKFQTLNANKAVDFLKELSFGNNIDTLDAFILPNTIKNPFLNLLESSHVVASGPGANRNSSGPSTLLTWHIKCGVILLNDPLFNELKYHSQKTLTMFGKNISFSVIGWHVITGFQKHYIEHGLLRRRRNVIAGTTTPVYSTIPISRATVVTTRVKRRKTSHISSTARLTRLQPSPTFSSPFGSTTSSEVFSYNSSSSKQSIPSVQSSSEILRSTNVSVSQLSTSNLHTFIQPSLTSNYFQRNTTYMLLPSSGNLVFSSRSDSTSNDILSSTVSRNKTFTISSYLNLNITNYTTSLGMSSSNKLLPLAGSSSFSSATLNSFVISSNRTSKIVDKTTAGVSSRNSSTIKYFLISSSNTSTISKPQQTQTYSDMSLDVLTGTTGLTSPTIYKNSLSKTQSEYESLPTLTTMFMQLSSSTAKYMTLNSTQVHVKTSSYVNSVDKSSIAPIDSTTQLVLSYPSRTSALGQTETIVSFVLTRSVSLSVAPSFPTTSLSLPVSNETETTTRKLTIVSSELIKSSLNDSPTIISSSYLSRTRPVSIAFSLKSSVSDNKTSNSILFQTSRIQTEISSTLSEYLLSDFVGTTTAISPIQTFFVSVSQTKQNTFVASTVTTLPRTRSDKRTTKNVTATTFLLPMSKSIGEQSSIGLTTSFLTTGITPNSTVHGLTRTTKRSQPVISNITSKTFAPLPTPSPIHNFTTMQTLSFTYFTKEPSSRPLVTPTSDRISLPSYSVSSFGQLPVVTRTPLLSSQISSAQRVTVQRPSPSLSSSSVQILAVSSSQLLTASSSIIAPSSPSLTSSSSAKLSIQSPSTLFSFVQSTVISSSSQSVTSGQSVIVQSSPSLTSSSSAKLSVQSPSTLFSFVQSTVISSSSQSVTSGQSVIVQSSPSLTLSSSAKLSVQSPSTLFSFVQSTVISSSSQSVTSGQSVIVQSSPSLTSLSSGKLFIQSPSTSFGSIVQRTVISSSSQSVTSGQSVIIKSSPSLTSSSSAKLSIQSPSTLFSFVQSTVISSSSQSVISGQSVIVQSSPSLTLSSSAKLSVQSPSTLFSFVQSTVISSSSQSVTSGQSVIVQSSPSLTSSSSGKLFIQSPSTSFGSIVQRTVISSSSQSVTSGQSVIIKSSPSLTYSSSSAKLSIQSPSTSFSSIVQSNVISSSSQSVTSGQSVIIKSSPSLTYSSSSAKLSIQSPSTLFSFVQSNVISSSSQSVTSGQFVIVQSSPSLTSSSSGKLFIQSPSTSFGSIVQRTVISSSSQSVTSGQSVIVQSSPSLTLSSLVKLSVQSPLRSFSSVLTVVISSSSQSVASGQSAIVKSSPSLTLSSFVKLSVQHQSPPFSLLQSFLVSSSLLSAATSSSGQPAITQISPSLTLSTAVPVVINQTQSALSSSIKTTIVPDSPSPSASSSSQSTYKNTQPSTASSSVQSSVQSLSVSPPSLSLYSIDISGSASLAVPSLVKSTTTQNTQPSIPSSVHLTIYSPSPPTPFISVEAVNVSTLSLLTSLDTVQSSFYQSQILPQLNSSSYFHYTISQSPSLSTSSHFDIVQRSSPYIPLSSSKSVPISSPSLTIAFSIYSLGSSETRVKQTQYISPLLTSPVTSSFKFSSSPSSFETSTKSSIFGSSSIGHNVSSSILLYSSTSKTSPTSSSLSTFKSSFYYPSFSSHGDTSSRYRWVSITTNVTEVQRQSSISPPDLSVISSTSSYLILISSASIVPHSTTSSIVRHPTSSTVPHPTPSIVPHPTSSIVPYATSSIVPHPTSSIVPHATSSIVPHPTSSIVPHPTSSIVPHATSLTVPHPTSSIVPHPTSSIVSYATSSIVPHPTSSIVPQPTSSIVPHATSSTVPRPTSSIVPHPTPSIVPYATSSIVPHPTSSIVPHPTSSIVPYATSSIVPHPTTPSNNSPKLYNSFDLLTAKVGRVFRVQVPIDTFHDREDGNTRNLILNCLDSKHKPLSRSSWLQFNSTTQTFYGIALRSQLEQIKSAREYIIVARDSEGSEAYDAFTVDLQENDETLALMFTLRIVGTNLEMFSQDLNNVLLLVEKIASYYGDKDESMIQVMSLDDGSLLFAWSNTTVLTCNLDLINELTSKIITKEGNIQRTFQNALLPAFVAENVYGNRTGACISPASTVTPPAARVSSHDYSLWFKFVLPGLLVGLLIIIVAVTCFIKRRHSGAKVLKLEEKTFKRRKPIILHDEIEITTLPGKPILLPDDSPTPNRHTNYTSFTNPDFDEEFPQWPSPISSAPSYGRHPPKYGETRGYGTPPPPYKLPPLYNVK